MPTKSLAVVSLVTGIVGMTIFPIMFSIVALVTSYLARLETRYVPPRATVYELATAGSFLGWIPIAITFTGVLYPVALYVLHALG